MKISSVGIAVFAIILICSPLNAEELTKAEIAARDFSYQGVSIGTTLKDFKRRFPKAELMESDKPSMTSKYFTVSGGGRTTAIIALFFPERIYCISITFLPNEVSGFGGQVVLAKRFTDTFGQPDINKDINKVGISKWWFPRIQRDLGYGCEESGSCVIIVIDTNIEEQVTAIKAKQLHLGF